MNRRTISVGVAVFFTALCLWLAARNVQFATLGGILAGAKWRWLVPILLIGLLDILIRALRWRILLSQAVSASVMDLFRLEAIGLAVNNMLFARLGEVLRGVLAARQLGIPVATSLASVVVERALDVAALLGLFCGAAWLAPDIVPAPIRHAGALLLGAVIAALIFLVLAERTLEDGAWLERRLRA